MGRRFSSRCAFIEGHGAAMHFTWTALEDYLLARFGISKLLLSGFELGTQAVEKLLKAFLLFSDPTFGKKEKNVLRAVRARAKELGRTKEFAHDVVAALDLAEKSGFSSSPVLRDRVERINAYYLKRYPSGGDLGGLGSLSTADVHDLDETVFEIWDVDRTGFSWTGDKTPGVQGGSYAKGIQEGLGGRDRSRRRGRGH